MDVILSDHVQVAQICGSTFSLIIILSRFEAVAFFLCTNSRAALLTCTIFTFASACYHVNLNFVFVARLLSLLDLALFEATVSEHLAWVVIMFISVSGSLAFILAQFLSGEIASGSIFEMLTGKFRPEGMFYLTSPVHVLTLVKICLYSMFLLML